MTTVRRLTLTNAQTPPPPSSSSFFFFFGGGASTVLFLLILRRPQEDPLEVFFLRRCRRRRRKRLFKKSLRATLYRYISLSERCIKGAFLPSFSSSLSLSLSFLPLCCPLCFSRARTTVTKCRRKSGLLQQIGRAKKRVMMLCLLGVVVKQISPILPACWKSPFWAASVGGA